MHKFFGRRFRRPTLIALGCTAFLLGAACAIKIELNAAWLLCAPLLVWRARRQDVWCALALLIVAFGAGNFRATPYARQLDAYGSLMKQKVVLIGTAQNDAVYGRRSQLAFTLGEVRLVVPQSRSLVGALTVSGFGPPAVFRGDRVRVQGELYPTLGGNQASIGFAQLQVLAHHGTWLDGLRRRFTAGMQSALPEPVASFGLGLLIGQRNTLPAAVTQELTMAGLVHIIAVSGYNLTIILGATRRLFAKRSKFQSTAVFVMLIGAFVLLTGSSPSIVRASIVSLLSIAAWYYGREIKPLVLLLLSAAISVYASPVYIWGNVSWYLSFLAFGGILLLAPLVTGRIFSVRRPATIVNILIESLCAEAATMPYVLHTFGQLSLVSLPANALVVALVPVAMLLSLVAGVAGMVAPALAGWVSWPAKELLTYMLSATKAFSAVPHAFLQHIAFPAWQMIAAYVALVCIAFAARHGKSPKYAIITDEKTETAEGG